MATNNCVINRSRRNFLAKLGVISVGLIYPGTLIKSAPSGIIRGKVALERAKYYNYDYLKSKITDMVEKLGGLSDLIRPGDKVGIKLNLTGGVAAAVDSITKYGGFHATETFWTHPTVTRVVAEIFKDAGAGEIYFMEASYDEMDSFRYGGFDKVANYVGATIINLNHSNPYSDWETRSIDSFYRWADWPMNGMLSNVDCFVSLPKMKQHATAGLTNAMKNLIGIVPLGIMKYTLGESKRMGLHRDENGIACPDCLVKAIVDLNTIRCVDFAVVDGIYTETGSEGTWGGGFTPIQPGLLVAGKNAVAVDAVCTAVMGFDPEAADYNQPFKKCMNYLRLADDERNLGPHKLSEIEVVGKKIDDVMYNWTPLKSASAQEL